MSNSETHKELNQESEREELKELLKFTIPGYIGGLTVGFLLDSVGLKQNPLGQAVVRTLSGEGESIFEGFYAIRQRLKGAMGSMAEAYGWGKLLGMFVPWIIDFSSRLIGIDVNGVGGFYIPFFYALSDQVGANISGFIYLRKKEKSFAKTVLVYFKNPMMITSILVILLVPFALLAGRLLGFSPNTQVYTALETIAANLCWLPPVVGLIFSKDRR